MQECQLPGLATFTHLFGSAGTGTTRLPVRVLQLSGACFEPSPGAQDASSWPPQLPGAAGSSWPHSLHHSPSSGVDSTAAGAASCAFTGPQQQPGRGTATLQELHLGPCSLTGCPEQLVDEGWLRTASNVADAEVIQLLQAAGCEVGRTNKQHVLHVPCTVLGGLHYSPAVCVCIHVLQVPVSTANP